MPTVLFAQAEGLGEGDPVFITVGSGGAVPTGVETQFQYSGFLLNDTSVIDKYRVIGIDGLDDADVRDTREDNPSYHGENALKALYGGRTLAIRGRIESYNLFKLRDMQMELRSNFAELEEKPLYFLTGNPATEHYINCRKFSKLQWSEEQTRENDFYRDFLITLRASDPRFYLTATREVTLQPNKVGNGSFETDISGWTQLNTGYGTLTFARENGWAGEGSWSYRIKGTHEASVTPRFLGIQSTTMINVNANTPYKFQADVNIVNAVGAGSPGTVEIDWYQNDGTTFISTSTVANMPNTVGISTISANVTSPAAAQKAVLRLQQRSTQSSDVVDYYLDRIWLAEDAGQTVVGEVHVPNLGNIETQPIISLYGALDDVAWTNIPENGATQRFALKTSVSILGSQVYLVDVKTPSVTREDGTNKFQDLDISSDWTPLGPGDNVIRLKSDESVGSTGDARIVFTYQDAFI